jgi:EAL domain
LRKLHVIFKPFINYAGGASVSFVNKIGGLAVICAAIGGVVLAWQNHTSAPEISMLILGGLCVLGLAGAIIAFALAARARQETAKLSLLVENAVDRLERRHDGDHARLVMTLAALDARSSNRDGNLDKPEEPILINEINASRSKTVPKKLIPANSSSDAKGRGKGAGVPKIDYDERQLLEAVTAKKLPLSLQPIFEMPSADVRGYLAFAQVGSRDIRHLAAKTKLNRVDFDYQLLFATAKAARQILTRVPAKSPLFCTISGASLNDAASLARIVALYEAQPILQDTLILLVASEDFAQIKEAAFDTLRLGGIHMCIEGIPANSDAFRHSDSGYWFVNASDAASMSATEFKKSYGELATAHNMKLVALEGDEEAQLVDLIDLNISLLTSRHLSPPRLVRDA